MSSSFVEEVAARVMGRRSWGQLRPGTLLKFTTLHPQVQKHLSRVYMTLASCLAICALGCIAGLYIPGLLWMTQLGALGCMLALGFTPATEANLNKRYGYLAGFSFSQGCALTPLVALASALYPGVVFTAVLATAAIFLCFSGAALLTPRRSYLFLGGFLTAALLGLSVVRLTTWLMRAHDLGFSLELYVGLLVFTGYILFDTQVIIEKAYAGHMDHVQHAMDLLVDLLALFARVLVILVRQAEKREEDARRKKRRD